MTFLCPHDQRRPAYQECTAAVTVLCRCNACSASATCHIPEACTAWLSRLRLAWDSSRQCSVGSWILWHSPVLLRLQLATTIGASKQYHVRTVNVCCAQHLTRRKRLVFKANGQCERKAFLPFGLSEPKQAMPCTTAPQHPTPPTPLIFFRLPYLVFNHHIFSVHIPP